MSILLKAIYETQLEFEPVKNANNSYFEPPTSSLTKSLVVLACCRTIFSSSIAPYIIERFVKEKMECAEATSDSLIAHCYGLYPLSFASRTEEIQSRLFKMYPNTRKYSGISSFSSGLDVASAQISMRNITSLAVHHNQHNNRYDQAMYNTFDAVEKFIQILLKYSATAYRFSPALYLNENSLARTRDVGNHFNGLPSFIKNGFGRNLKRMMLENAHGPAAVVLRELQQCSISSHHPLPLLEELLLVNCHDTCLESLIDKKLINIGSDEDDEDDSNDEKFSPFPSLRKLSWLVNAEKVQPTFSNDLVQNFVDVIKTYAKTPSTRNNLQEISFDVSSVYDPYDIIAVADVNAIILACAEFLPHCLRSLTIGAESRDTLERDDNVLRCFEKFEVLERFEIGGDLELENPWSQDENGEEVDGNDDILLFPKSLTCLRVSLPDFDVKSLEKMLSTPGRFPFLKNLSFTQDLVPIGLNRDVDNEEERVTKTRDCIRNIFTNISQTLQTVELLLSFHESEKTASYADFNKVCFDPSSSAFLGNLENFWLSLIEGSGRRNKNRASSLFPLPPSVRRLSIFDSLSEISSDDLLRILCGDHNSDNAENRSNLIDLSLQGGFKPAQIQNFASLLTGHELVLPHLKRLGFNIVIRAQSAQLDDQLMHLIRYALPTLSSIECFEISGYCRGSLKNFEALADRENVENLLRESGLEKKLRHLHLLGYEY